MLTPDAIATAAMKPDIPTLEAAFEAFVLYPNGEELAGFIGPDAMLSAFTDEVCAHLVGDLNPLPEAVHDALLDYAARHHGLLMQATYRDGAALAIARWQGFRDRFAA